MLFNLIFSSCTSESVLGEQTKLHHSAPGEDFAIYRSSSFSFLLLIFCLSLCTLPFYSKCKWSLVARRTGDSWMNQRLPQKPVRKVLLPCSCSDAFNVFGPLSLYSIIFPSEEKLGQSLLYEFCCGPFEIM